MKEFVIAVSLLAGNFLYAQNPAVSIATWKNNTSGAYNIIHDDFGDNVVIGIQNYADTMHYNRGLRFTFGAITTSCEGNPGMYAKAQSMINNHGHEIINHSHSHTCAIGNDWCTAGLWAEPSTENFDQEIDYSTTSIFNGTGVRPRYFIFPYDLFNEAANEHLKSEGYIGSRTGNYNGVDDANFSPDAEGFFRSSVVIDAVTTGGVTKAVNLNYWVDYAINNNVWVNRELHNVGNSGWGHVTVAEYRTHLNYLKQKVDAGELWVGTVSEILSYQMQKKNYTPSSSFNSGTQQITINWNTPSFNVANWLAPLTFKSPVTLLVDMSAHPGAYKAFQNGIQLTDVTRVGNELRINAYPHQGAITLDLQDCSVICINQQPISFSINEGQNATFSVDASTSSGVLGYQWYHNGNLINGATSDEYSVTSATTSDAGTYHVVLSKGATTLQSTNATLTVNTQTPFLTRISIPGKIEAENFDIGGEGISFYETSNTNQGSAPGYRSGPVDIENCADGGYDVGYITDGEWLEYSVNIAAESDYDFTFRIAASNVGGGLPQAQLFLDGSTLTPATNLIYTGGWQVWQNVEISDVHLPAGDHILRVYFPQGDVNFNYVNVTGGTVTSLNKSLEGNWFEVYPNPASDKLHIEHYLDQYTAIECSILDLSGHVMLTKELTAMHTELLLANLPKGTFIIQLQREGLRVQKRITVY